MEQTLQALNGILLKAIPSILLLIFLHFYLKFMLFRPLDRILQKRRELTDGAKKAAAKSLEIADRKAGEFEEKLREARSVIYKEQEEIRRQWLEQQAKQVEEARAKVEASVATAKREIAEQAAAARVSLSNSSEALADQIASVVMRRAA